MSQQFEAAIEQAQAQARERGESLQTDGDLTPERANWALAAVTAFCAQTNQSVEYDLEEAIADLMADLLHLAMQHNMDGRTLVARAQRYFIYETLHDDDHALSLRRIAAAS